MSKQSAGLLPYRFRQKRLEVLLVHPGGPFWAKKDLGSWSIPKGEFHEGEDALVAAQREFREETGFSIGGEFKPLSSIRQKSGKLVQAWAVEGDLDPAAIKSNTFELEWPPKSGRTKQFPELIDRAAWFSVEVAREKINPGQVVFLDRLMQMLKSSGQ
jgi:predicted NUDIX family NTP pyrophosphohydrolase